MPVEDNSRWEELFQYIIPFGGLDVHITYFHGSEFKQITDIGGLEKNRLRSIVILFLFFFGWGKASCTVAPKGTVWLILDLTSSGLSSCSG